MNEGDRSLEALGVLECETIHSGIGTIDAMAKMAPIQILASDPIPPGRFLIVIGGGVGEVDSAYRRGLEIAGPLYDRLLLPEAHPAVLRSLEPPARQGGSLSSAQQAGSPSWAQQGGSLPSTHESEVADALGLFETSSVSAALDGADRGVKGAAVRLLHVHVARGIAGHAFGVFEGRQDMVEAALELAAERGRAHGRWIGATLLARPDRSVVERIMAGRWGYLRGQEIL